VACREVKAKRELVRLVCISENRVEVDLKGKKVGRGAYLCRVQECWDNGINKNHLGYALRTTLSRENREQLIEFSQDILEE